MRKTTPRLPEPPGARTGGEGSLRLLLLGDSCAAGVGAATQDEALLGRLVGQLGGPDAVRWRLVARTGWRAEEGLAALAELDETIDVAVVVLGVNDVTGRDEWWEWTPKMQGVVGDVRNRLGADRVVLLGLPPMGRFPALPQPLRWYLGRRARAFDRALRELADAEPSVVWVPSSTGDETIDYMASDGFHPGPLAYEAMAERVATALVPR